MIISSRFHHYYKYLVKNAKFITLLFFYNVNFKIDIEVGLNNPCVPLSTPDILLFYDVYF